MLLNLSCQGAESGVWVLLPFVTAARTQMIVAKTTLVL